MCSAGMSQNGFKLLPYFPLHIVCAEKRLPHHKGNYYCLRYQYITQFHPYTDYEHHGSSAGNTNQLPDCHADENVLYPKPSGSQTDYLPSFFKTKTDQKSKQR